MKSKKRILNGWTSWHSMKVILINQNLKQEVNKKNLSMIIGSTEFFDKDYADVLPIKGFAT